MNDTNKYTQKRSHYIWPPWADGNDQSTREPFAHAAPAANWPLAKRELASRKQKIQQNILRPGEKIFPPRAKKYFRRGGENISGRARPGPQYFPIFFYLCVLRPRTLAQPPKNMKKYSGDGGPGGSKNMPAGGEKIRERGAANIFHHPGKKYARALGGCISAPREKMPPRRTRNRRREALCAWQPY